MNVNKTKAGLLVLMSSMGCVYSQEAVPATGGDANGAGGTLSYSVGQVVYTANSSATGSINQGVQQPYDISVISTGEELNNDIVLSVFPNPTSDILTLRIENTDFSGYSYELYNSNGQLIQQEKIDNNYVEISARDLSAAMYVLKVRSTKEVVKSFTVIKH